MKSPLSALTRLERLRLQFGESPAREKIAALTRLSRSRLKTAAQVKRLHEILCFMRAYPDSREVLDAAAAMLASFDRRGDLRRRRAALRDTGIAGTAISYPFFWFTAVWLARRWPERLTVNWTDFEKKDELPDLLGLMLPYAQMPVVDEFDYSPREWVELLKAPKESDAAFLIRRFANLRADSFLKEKLFEQFDIPVKITPGPKTPSRTRAGSLPKRPALQSEPLFRGRPDLTREARRAPLSVRPAPAREARALIDLAREAMVTRQRDLDIFENANPADVRVMEFTDGLALAWFGVLPERRLLLETLYGFLILKNGVPIGYGGSSALFGSSEIFFNAFKSFRGAQSGTLFARVLAGARALLGSDTFTLDPYQLGRGNAEAIDSGAWWFYQKLGFRPKDAELLRLMRRELKKMKSGPRYRSSEGTLRRLAEGNLYLHLGRVRGDVLGELSPGEISMGALRLLARRFSSDRGRSDGACAKEAARLLKAGSLRGWNAAERQAWTRWAPLILALPGIERWDAARRRALVAVIKAKGGSRESNFAHLMDAHRPLRAALLRLRGEAATASE
ncbi:MAG: hypothetical protein CO113_11905 [Elusimicrobia bacterium CG_4_9_14_3_um_filter_62_55]|nr:MAG: hypothetical protein COR54_00670 [Elusimicrobia bacterium CG22_combo_CG10-13_8_21_14_all_63_91]PJA11903.1 MAG: hypothetical protein COX66_18635 [Elusimicrobia bacterium CG_4_10_14_0_2_um_filter_63_34]PJB24809.1 MAG: hypothetical protein CO113_11905 [Elusimicrobia bacterium CG_4_9_14_3_um_filter_62_55]